ncbi:peptidase [Salegentibacter salinarum]|uniref:Peptidase n=1 Tax=Salegentibacter salinarum TaxID=447422 RepID=A0A2N0TWJ1_9FLAO|nr:M57 family metalloprotease [Salegentibacter salinarum]PKD19113.1 peptidase [Salegentibacter salinarum]SKB95350.1 Dual-action HEIGH metallo-peptidase [Salegentibacter salinarum]
MKLKKLLLAVFSVSLLCVSCEQEDIENTTPEAEAEVISQDKVSKAVLAKLEALNLNTEDVEISEFVLPDGTKKQTFIIEGDIAIDAEQLDAMQPGNITSKQYRTYNLVSAPRTLNVVGWTGGSQSLTQKQRDALQAALDNYNEIEIGLSFTLEFSTNQAAADIVVFQNPNGAAGGVAGFPSAGNPYGFVQIYSGMEAFSLGTNTHVMAHEIGHTLGLRHTDWFTRQSCGRPSFGELANPSGAVHIPGTPFRLDPESIMLSCFSTNEDGEFGANDVVALEYLY